MRRLVRTAIVGAGGVFDEPLLGLCRCLTAFGEQHLHTFVRDGLKALNRTVFHFPVPVNNAFLNPFVPPGHLPTDMLHSICKLFHSEYLLCFCDTKRIPEKYCKSF